MLSYSVLIRLHEGGMFFRTDGKFLPGYTASHPTYIIILTTREYPKSYRFITYRLTKDKTCFDNLICFHREKRNIFGWTEQLMCRTYCAEGYTTHLIRQCCFQCKILSIQLVLLISEEALSRKSLSSSSCSWRIRRVSCSLILKMKLVPPSLPRSSYVSSSFWFIL